MDGSLGLALVSPPELVFGRAIPLIPLSVTVSSRAMLLSSPPFEPPVRGLHLQQLVVLL